jgi:RelB Antitoxin alpha helical domain
VLRIKKRYVLNEEQEAIEVILDLKTFEKIENLLEDRLFGRILEQEAKKKPLSLRAAKRRYARIKQQQ